MVSVEVLHSFSTVTECYSAGWLEFLD